MESSPLTIDPSAPLTPRTPPPPPTPPPPSSPRPRLLLLNSCAAPVGAGATPSFLELRLFYVRVSPCAADAGLVPPRLIISFKHSGLGRVAPAIEINGSRAASGEAAALQLRLDRLDRAASEATYVSTDAVRLTAGASFEVADNNGNLVLSGALERTSGSAGWTMDCCPASPAFASTLFVQPLLGIASPVFEVYVAGCVGGTPVILTQSVLLSLRRRVTRLSSLGAIPEGEETSGSATKDGVDGLIHQKPITFAPEEDVKDVDNVKLDAGRYTQEGWYQEDDDGELTWFNAGVRVGVGIGLGMCVGIGIGVGLLMRSYQATTRTFKRRFF